ncbi:MAG: hypothetical protein FJX80_05160 [Bacteroidetes bacterium]|nr:hypothetical protein [Bacteroidota bacterium]
MKNLNYINLLKFSLVIVGVGASFFLFNGPSVTEGEAAMAEFRESLEMDVAIWFTIGLMIFAISIVVAFFIWSLIIQPKKTILSIIGLAVCFLVYGIFMGIGTSDNVQSLALKGDKISQGVVNTTSAGIYTIIFCLVVGFLVILIGPFFGRYRNYKK